MCVCICVCVVMSHGRSPGKKSVIKFVGNHEENSYLDEDEAKMKDIWKRADNGCSLRDL